MGLFRRKPKGRHALGAAVTSIPSGPVPAARLAAAARPVAAALPPWEAAAPVAAQPAVPALRVGTPVAPDVASEIAQLIATGQAWGDTAAGAAGTVATSSAGHVGAPEAPEAIAPTPVPTIGAAAVVAAPPAGAAIATQTVAPVACPPAVAVQPLTAWSGPGPAVAAAPPARARPAEAAPALDAVTVPEQAEGGAREVLEAALAELTVLQATGAPTAPAEVAAPRRVQLGFRDGTSTTLDPSSTQARALEELAQSLTRRD